MLRRRPGRCPVGRFRPLRLQTLICFPYLCNYCSDFGSWSWYYPRPSIMLLTLGFNPAAAAKNRRETTVAPRSGGPWRIGVGRGAPRCPSSIPTANRARSRSRRAFHSADSSRVVRGQARPSSFWPRGPDRTGSRRLRRQDAGRDPPIHLGGVVEVSRAIESSRRSDVNRRRMLGEPTGRVDLPVRCPLDWIGPARIPSGTSMGVIDVGSHTKPMSRPCTQEVPVRRPRPWMTTTVQRRDPPLRGLQGPHLERRAVVRHGQLTTNREVHDRPIPQALFAVRPAAIIRALTQLGRKVRPLRVKAQNAHFCRVQIGREIEELFHVKVRAEPLAEKPE